MSRLKKVDIITRLQSEPNEKHIAEVISEVRQLRREMAAYKAAPPGPRRIQKATDAECALAKECFSSIISAENKRKWMDERDLFVADGRAFVVVDTPTHLYFMDAITGSLYNFGECLTSTRGRTGFVRDRARAEQILSKFRGECSGGSDDGVD